MQRAVVGLSNADLVREKSTTEWLRRDIRARSRQESAREVSHVDDS